MASTRLVWADAGIKAVHSKLTQINLCAHLSHSETVFIFISFFPAGPEWPDVRPISPERLAQALSGLGRGR